MLGGLGIRFGGSNCEEKLKGMNDHSRRMARRGSDWQSNGFVPDARLESEAKWEHQQWARLSIHVDHYQELRNVA